MKSSDSAHGYVSITWHNNQMQVEAFGPFNLEGILAAFAQIREQATFAPQYPWWRIDVLDEQTLGSPDVMRVIGLSYLWCLENGCAGVASVCSTRIQAQILAEFKSHTGANVIAVDNLAAAQDWCVQQQVSAKPG